MKINVRRCANSDPKSIEAWYKDRIGEQFEVVWEVDEYYFVKYDNGRKASFINKKDADIIS